MLAVIMPFFCMGLGLFLGSKLVSAKLYRAVDGLTNLSLILLMLTIGANVGVNETVVAKIGTVGLNCLLTCLCAIAGSVIFCLVLEKTVVPLKKYSELQIDDECSGSLIAETTEAEKKGAVDPILILIPISVLGGALGGYLFLPRDMTSILDCILWGSLVVLYISVGIGMGRNRGVVAYLRRIGFRMLYLVLGIYLGGMAGGAISSWLTGMPLHYAVISAAGSGYYSVTGAAMLSSFGAEAGVYGFMVNVFRDFFTVVLLPVLGRLSLSAPIASGGAGNMDSMLVPVTKVVGRELGAVALIAGVALTFLVPLMLPLLCGMSG